METIHVTRQNKSEMMKKYHFVRHYNNSSIFAVSKSKRPRIIEKGSYLTYKTPIRKDHAFLIIKVYKRIKPGKYLLFE